MPRYVRIALGLVAAVAAYVAWVFFQPDEALAPTLGDNAVSAGTRRPSEATIGLIGLEAPAGTDFMAHGRAAFAEAVRVGGYPMDFAKQLRQEKPRLHATWPENMECWLYSPGGETPEQISQNCATPAQLQTVLDENAELLQRYRVIQKLPTAADGESFGGRTTISLGKLVVADIANELRLGQTERAYRKWADNHLHQSRMVGYEGNWVMMAINMVSEGLSFIGLELLLAKAPQVMQTHREELLELLKPRDDVWKNIAGTMRAEVRAFDQIRAELPIQRFVRMNRLKNRFGAFSNDLIDALAANMADLPTAIATVKARHDVWRAGDVFDPITGSAWRLLMSGQIKTGELIRAKFAKEAQRRLYAIKVMRATANVADANIETNMKAMPREFHNPTDGTPAQWDAGKRMLYFNIHGGGRVEVTIP